MSSAPSSSAELRAFEAAARTASMSAAAQMLGLRQPTVSAHIARLERDFGVELFRRGGRGVVLTPFGRLLHEATYRMLQAEQHAASLLLSARNQYEGHLAICAIGPHNVVPMLARFRAQHPRVRVEVKVADSRQIAERILGEQEDVGILLHAVDDPRVHCVPYRRQPLVVFAAKTHPLAGHARLRLADLHSQEFVVREQGSQTRKVFESGLAAAGVAVRSTLQMGSRESVREAVAQGLGLGVVARTALVPDERLVVLPVVDLELATEVHVICLRERRQASLVASFLTAVEAARLASVSSA